MKKLWIISVLVILTGCNSFNPNPRPWTTEEKTLLVVSCLACAADNYTQKRVFDRGGYEANPIIGKNGSTGKLVRYGITSQTVTILIAHYFPKYRRFILGGKALVNTSLAIHNKSIE